MNRDTGVRLRIGQLHENVRRADCQQTSIGAARMSPNRKHGVSGALLWATGFEELAARAAIAEQASVPGTRCPLSKEYIDKADIGPLSICLKYGLAAYEAAQRYPETAAKVFAVYGMTKCFRRVLDRMGIR